MKPSRTSVAVIAAGALLAISGAQSAQQAPTRASAAHWDAGQPAALATLPTAGASPLQSLLAAAEDGDADAMNLLGVLHVLGIEVPTDYSKAVDWFQKAIEAGSAGAMHNLAQMYLYGIGVPRDYANAFHWFQRSAAYGNVYSMYSAAVMAESGLGTARDLRVSRALFRDAAESGFAPAMVRVSDELARGAAKRDLVEAYAWLQIASQSELSLELQIPVLSKMEDLGARLGPDRRNDARARATHIIAAIRSRTRSAAPDLRAPSQPLPQAGGRTHLIRFSTVQL